MDGRVEVVFGECSMNGGGCCGVVSGVMEMKRRVRWGWVVLAVVDKMD